MRSTTICFDEFDYSLCRNIYSLGNHIISVMSTTYLKNNSFLLLRG